MNQASQQIKLVRLTKNLDISNFECGDGELDNFLIEDALEYQSDYFANTTLMVINDNIVNFFSLAADSINLTKNEKNKEGITTSFSSFPALKIARLATDSRFQNFGYGTLAVKYCIGLSRHLNDEHRHDGIGCRYVTVDAYPKSVEWYKTRFGFVENEARARIARDTVSLRLDILPVRDIAP